MKRKRGYRRGYPMALLVGLEDDHAVVWQIFSHVAKPHLTLKLDGKRTDRKALYNFHESIVDALRPALREGVRSIIVTAPMKTTFTTDFLSHIRKHHAYLIQSEKPDGATFVELVGSADQPRMLAELMETKKLRELITMSVSHEADQVLNALEKHLSSIGSLVLFSLREIEDTVYDSRRLSKCGTAYLILTEKYLADSENKNRLHHLLQISKNRKVKTRIVSASTPAGERISQFGGIVFFARPTKGG